MGTRVYTVYALACPETGDVVYVGRTGNLRRRIKQHISGGLSSTSLYVRRWVRRLASVGRFPRVIELAHVVDSDKRACLFVAEKAEREWISTFERIGMPLLNERLRSDPAKARAMLADWAA